MAEGKEELKSLLMRMRKKRKTGALKPNIQKSTFMTFDGEKMEAVIDFILLDSKITEDGDYRHEIKRCLLPGRKVMTNLDHMLKSTDITLPRNVCIVKAVVFPVVTYNFESWTIMKVEHQRIDAFELWCWGRLLRVLWTARS